MINGDEMLLIPSLQSIFIPNMKNCSVELALRLSIFIPFPTALFVPCQIEICTKIINALYEN